jgi:hypothetical protein
MVAVMDFTFSQAFIHGTEGQLPSLHFLHRPRNNLWKKSEKGQTGMSATFLNRLVRQPDGFPHSSGPPCAGIDYHPDRKGMDMDALTKKGFLTIALLAALLAGLAIGGFCSATRGLGLPELAATLTGAVFLGFTVAGVWYLVQLSQELKSLHLPAGELAPGEEVLRETPGSITHRPSGQPRSWTGPIGGRLVLTSRRLVFLAHRGQPQHYRLDLPLQAITEARPAEVLPSLPGGLQVVRQDGRQELFLFGIARVPEVEQWVKAIRQTCGHSLSSIPDRI